MVKERLTVADHKKLSAHMVSIDDHISSMLTIMNGRVPTTIIDKLLTFKPLDKQINNLRSKLESLAYKQLGVDVANLYYGSTKPQPICRMEDIDG